MPVFLTLGPGTRHTSTNTYKATYYGTVATGWLETREYSHRSHPTSPGRQQERYLLLLDDEATFAQLVLISQLAFITTSKELSLLA